MQCLERVSQRLSSEAELVVPDLLGVQGLLGGNDLVHGEGQGGGVADILPGDVGAGAVLAGVVEPASAVPVIVEDDVLVGANAVIIEGCHIGKGAVVAAGAIVTQDVPENAVVAGCPARVIKMKDEKTTMKTALEADLRTL